MNNLEGFITSNYQGLLQTFLTERKRSNNIGALFINLDLSENNVYYLSIDMIKDETIRNNIVERNKLDTKKALLYCYDKNNSELVEINL